jgi:hypothetical protein
MAGQLPGMIGANTATGLAALVQLRSEMIFERRGNARLRDRRSYTVDSWDAIGFLISPVLGVQRPATSTMLPKLPFCFHEFHYYSVGAPPLSIANCTGGSQKAQP